MPPPLGRFAQGRRKKTPPENFLICRLWMNSRPSLKRRSQCRCRAPLDLPASRVTLGRAGLRRTKGRIFLAPLDPGLTRSFAIIERKEIVAAKTIAAVYRARSSCRRRLAGRQKLYFQPPARIASCASDTRDAGGRGSWGPSPNRSRSLSARSAAYSGEQRHHRPRRWDWSCRSILCPPRIRVCHL